MKKLLLVLCIFLLIGCTADNHATSLVTEQHQSGFWYGLWHGFISPITFLLSLFVDSVKMYDINNNGGWYDFGFVLGAGTIIGGSKK